MVVSVEGISVGTEEEVTDEVIVGLT